MSSSLYTNEKGKWLQLFENFFEKSSKTGIIIPSYRYTKSVYHIFIGGVALHRADRICRSGICGHCPRYDNKSV